MITRRGQRGAGRAAFAALALLIAAAAGIVLMRAVFVVKDIEVVGNGAYDAAEVVALTGIRIGESIFGVGAESVGRGFYTVGRLGFEGIEKRMPSTVRVFVRERTPRVAVSYAGLGTVLDGHGYAIEQARDLDGAGLPMVTGLQLTNCEVGRRAVSAMSGQIEAMSAVVEQLYATQQAPMISELNVSDLDNLYLMTRGGMMVKLGDSEHAQQKLLWMNGALTQLTAEGIIKGIVDVSSASGAVYQDTSVAPQQAEPRAAEPAPADAEVGA